MENIAETGQLYQAERQIKIVRTDAAAETELAEDVELTENLEPIEMVQVKAPSDLDEPAGIIQSPSVKPAPADKKIKPVWDEMKAGYRYASGLFKGKSSVRG
jgi:hypothetical protein